MTIKGKKKNNTDNLSALAVGIGVVALIAGFGIYFNSPELNKTTSGGEQNTGGFVPAVVVVGEEDDDGGASNSSSSNSNDESAGSTPTIKVVQIDKSQFKKAPELAKVSSYINTESPVTLADLRGKVVLLDFWTYSCINCIRTIPYLNAWYEKYADDGLVIVGVHTPEFEFEKDYNNVRTAVEKFEIKYPVVQDNEKGTWKAYENRYWPRKYLIDHEGYIRYDHIGEGNYAETEKVIQSLLIERAAAMGAEDISSIDQSISKPQNAQRVDFYRINTPELYFGYEFARAPLGNSEGFKPGQTVAYSITEKNEQGIRPNTIYLEGEWKNNPDHMELQDEVGRIALKYSAKSVNIVAGGSGELFISLDGKALEETESQGADVLDSKVKIEGQRLYNLVMHQVYGDHYLVIDVIGKGFQIYAFTFG